jgi:superfamily I DNA/RNA helicase
VTTNLTLTDCGFLATPKPGYETTTSNLSKKSSIEKIIIKYLSELNKKNQIDFEQILYYAYKLLNSYPVISSILSKIFPYILVDEYQDTKEIQYHIISSILRASKTCTKLFIVGDPNQSIYQTLGGYPIEKIELEELGQIKIKQLMLSKNYRSSKKVIDYFDYFKTVDTNIKASGVHTKYNSKITLNKSVVKDDLIDEIVRLIDLNIKGDGISQNEICIVAPQWVHIASVARQLMVRLPDYSFDGPGMAPFSRDVENFWFKLSRIILTEPSPNIYVRRLRWSNEIINDLGNVGVNTFNVNAKRFLRLCNSIKVEETDGIDHLKEFFRILFSKLSINYLEFPSLIEHYNSFFDSCEKRIDKLRKDGLDYICNIEAFKKVFKQHKGITISTCHGVKGAEYDTVIAFAMLQDYIPHFNDVDGVENSKKLLYVIASRARKNLHFIAERKRLKPFGTPRKEHKTTQHIEEYNFNYDL